MITAAQKLNDPGKGVWGIASPDWTQENLYNTMLQAGGQAIAPDHKKSGFDDPKSVAGLQYALDFVTRYHVSPTAQQMTDTQPDQLFASGKVAMFADGDYDMPEYKAAAGLDADVAPLPAGPDGKKATVINGLANVIYAKTTENSEAAWEFVQYLGGKDANEIQAKTGTVIPAYNGLSATWVASTPQYHLQSFIDQLRRRRAVPGVEEHRGLDHADADHAGPDLGRQARSADRGQADRGPDERRTGQGVAGVSHRIPRPSPPEGRRRGTPGARARRPVAARRPMVLLIRPDQSGAAADQERGLPLLPGRFRQQQPRLRGGDRLRVLLVTVALTGFQFRLQKRWVHYA